MAPEYRIKWINNYYGGFMSVKSMALVRGVAAIGATAALMVGITFAAITSNTVTLSDNTITTGTAHLSIWDGGAFVTTPVPGFAVTGLVPGTWSSSHVFYLKNDGDVNLKLAANVPNAPVEPANGYGFTGWDQLYVRVSTDAAATNVVMEATMAQLMAGQVAFNDTLPAGSQGTTATEVAPGNYYYSVYLDPSTVSGSSAGVGDFDLNLTGTQTP
jgi:hypothetical protein